MLNSKLILYAVAVLHKLSKIWAGAPFCSEIFSLQAGLKNFNKIGKFIHLPPHRLATQI